MATEWEDMVSALDLMISPAYEANGLQADEIARFSAAHASHLDDLPTIDYHLSELGAIPNFYPLTLANVAHTETHRPSGSDAVQDSYPWYPPIHPTAPQPHNTRHHLPITPLLSNSMPYSTPTVAPCDSSDFMYSFTDTPPVVVGDPTAPTYSNLSKVVGDPTAPMYSNPSKPIDEWSIFYQCDLIPFQHGEQSSANISLPLNSYIQGRFSQVPGPPHPERTVHGDGHTRTMPEWHMPVRNRHSWLPAPQPTTAAIKTLILLAITNPSIDTPAIETPILLAVAPPSVTSIPCSALLAFEKEARDNLRQYALLEKPIWSSDDSAYIEQVVTKLAKVHFLKEAGKCFVY